MFLSLSDCVQAIHECCVFLKACLVSISFGYDQRTIPPPPPEEEVAGSLAFRGSPLHIPRTHSNQYRRIQDTKILSNNSILHIATTAQRSQQSLCVARPVLPVSYSQTISIYPKNPTSLLAYNIFFVCHLETTKRNKPKHQHSLNEQSFPHKLQEVKKLHILVQSERRLVKPPTRNTHTLAHVSVGERVIVSINRQ